MAGIWSDWPVISVCGCVLLFDICCVALLCYVTRPMYRSRSGNPPLQKKQAETSQGSGVAAMALWHIEFVAVILVYRLFLLVVAWHLD